MFRGSVLIALVLVSAEAFVAVRQFSRVGAARYALGGGAPWEWQSQLESGDGDKPEPEQAAKPVSSDQGVGASPAQASSSDWQAQLEGPASPASGRGPSQAPAAASRAPPSSSAAPWENQWNQVGGSSALSAAQARPEPAKEAAKPPPAAAASQAPWDSSPWGQPTGTGPSTPAAPKPAAPKPAAPKPAAPSTMPLAESAPAAPRPTPTPAVAKSAAPADDKVLSTATSEALVRDNAALRKEVTLLQSEVMEMKAAFDSELERLRRLLTEQVEKAAEAAAREEKKVAKKAAAAKAEAEAEPGTSYILSFTPPPSS